MGGMVSASPDGPAAPARTADSGQRTADSGNSSLRVSGCQLLSVLSTLVGTPGNASTGTVESEPEVAPRYEQERSPGAMNRLRRAFLSMNTGMVFMWRLGLGRWAEAWSSIAGRMLADRRMVLWLPDGPRRLGLSCGGSPADLSWVWIPITTAAAAVGTLAILLRRRS